MAAAYQAVLFDFDGVLVDSEPIHYACWRAVLEPIGIALDWEHYHRHFIGLSDRRMAEEVALLAPAPVSADAIYALYPRKAELFAIEMQRRLPFAPGVQELLPRLGAFQIAVVTSSGRAEVEPVLDAGGLLPLLAASVYLEDVTRHKPDPEPYLRAAQLLGVDRALVVEDSVAGQAAGRAAGFPVLAIPHPRDTARLVAGHLGLGWT